MKVIKLLFKIFFGAIFALIACVVLVFVLFFTVNGKEQADKEIQHLVNPEQHTALILYQDSRLGLTKKAVELASTTLQLEGYSVTLNHPRSDSPYDVKDYDLVILSSPVYAGNVSTPLLNYAKMQDFAGVKVLVLLTGADLAQTAEIEAVKEKVTGAESVNSIKVDKVDERIINSVKEVIGK